MSARTIFYQLFENYEQVVIPIIQREYAQGRAKIVRNEFLKALYDALCQPEDAPELPLDLDFIYGSVVNGSFQPLDGQQRLTTLFLLHWYLAWADNRNEDFNTRLVAGDQCRFIYEVRPSSRDFIDAIAKYVPEITAAECQDIDSLVTDQPWFFRSWRYDPTIRSALSMLNRIHELFRNTSGLYARLIDERNPAITFQLLDLKQFNLSDDLYIKMNARGKPLTLFETFKARFQRHLKTQFEGTRLAICGETSISEFFEHRIDNRWSDFFWPFRDSSTATFDAAVMNFLRVVIMITRTTENGATPNDLVALRSSLRVSNYEWFYENSWLDEKMVLVLITLLERWSEDPGKFRCYLPDKRYIDEEKLFLEIITRPTGLTFQSLALLAGYVQYIVHAQGEIDSANFNDWMRVVYNLATNTDYNRPEDLWSSFVGLQKLATHMNDINCYLASPDVDVRRFGFYRPQVSEERIKAHLLGFGEGWPERIDQAERHPYFRGQIGFLLHLSGLNLNDPEAELVRLDATTVHALGAPYDRYFACAAQMFDDIENDPTGIGRLWERALLAVGNYMLFVGQNNSLLTSSRNVAWSWKVLLRNVAAAGHASPILKELWDHLGEPASFVSKLNKLIQSQSNLDPWRKAIVFTPSVYDYGERKMLRFWDDGGVYLLKKSQMNGRHAELFTYCLYEDLKASTDILSLRLDYRETTSSSDEPGLSLSIRFDQQYIKEDIRFFFRRAENETNKFDLYLAEPQEINGKLISILKDEKFENSEGTWTRQVDRTEMKDVVLTLDHVLAKYT